MTPVKSCVTYVINSLDHVGNEEIGKAQRLAVRDQLPMSVVYCLTEWDDNVLDKLRPIEGSLGEYNIPLIVLVGPADKTLAGFIHHTSPLNIFHGGLPNLQKSGLSKHHYTWPGVVIDITRLNKLHKAGQISC